MAKFDIILDDDQAQRSLDTLRAKALSLEAAFASLGGVKPFAGAEEGAGRLKGALGGVAGAASATGASLTDALGAAQGKALAAAVAVGGLAHALASAANEGNQLKTLDTAFAALGGREQDMARLREQTAGLIPDATLVRMSNMGRAMGISAEQMGMLGKITLGTATMMGRDVVETYERMVLAVGKKEKELLDEAGIVFGSMVQLKSDYAKSVGKSVDEITAAEEHLIFYNATVAASSKQQAMASLAQGDAFARARAEAQNYADELKRQVADMVLATASGQEMTAQWAAVTEAMGGGAVVIELLQSAVGGVSGGLAGLAAMILPVIEPLSDLMALAQSGIAIWQMYAWVVGKSVGGALDLLVALMQPVVGLLDSLVSGARRVAEAMGADGLAAQLRKAEQGFADFRERASEGVDASKNLDDSVFSMVRSIESVSPAAATAVLSSEQIADAFAGASKEALGLQRQLIALGKIQAVKPEEFAKVNLGRDQQASILELKKFIDAAGGATNAASELQGRISAVAKGEAEQFGLTGSFVVRHYEQIEQARAFLETDQGAVNLKAAFGVTPAELDALEASLREMDDILESAQTQIAQKAAARQDKAGAGAAKKAKADAEKALEEWLRARQEAGLLMMGEEERQLATYAQTRSELMATLSKRAGAEDLVAQLGAQVHHVQAFGGAVVALNDDLEAMAKSMAAPNQQIERMAALFGDVANEDGVDAMTERLRELARAQREVAEAAMAAGDGAAYGQAMAMADAFGAQADSLAEQARQAQLTAARMKALRDVVTAAGGSMASMMAQLAEGSQGTADIMRSVFGALFDDLATTMVAWANAEIAQLALGPWAGLAASLAFQLVARSLAGFAKRAIGGGGAGAGGGGGSDSSSRRALDRERDRDDDRGPRTIIYNYGFHAPDETSAGVLRAEERGQRLSGRRTG